MQAQALLSTLGEQGITVRHDGDQLAVGPKSRLTPELREELLSHKPELLTLLRSDWPEECLDTERRFRTPGALLFPLIGGEVKTALGPGKLLQVLNGTAAVLYGDRVHYLKWKQVRPLHMERK